MAVPPPPSESERILRDARTAAELYYVQNLTMDSIARELQTSRSTVSRLLAKAREVGLVEIRIMSWDDQASTLQRSISDLWKLRAHVIPVPQFVSESERLHRVAMSTAHVLGQAMASNMVLGVAWGPAADAVSRHLQPQSTQNTLVVQLNGMTSSRYGGIDHSSAVLARFAEAFGADLHHFPVPAFFDEAATRLAMWRDRSVQRILQLQTKVDIALVGLGSPQSELENPVYSGEYLSAADVSALTQSGVVGDLANVFYRADGSYRDIAVNARSSGPDFTQFCRIPRRIAVVSGRSSLLSLRGAVAAGLITDLFIDEPTARWITASGSA